jgi:hypothetical protein
MPRRALVAHLRSHGIYEAFFLGDAIWEPRRNLCGLWILTTSHAGAELVRVELEVVPPSA